MAQRAYDSEVEALSLRISLFDRHLAILETAYARLTPIAQSNVRNGAASPRAVDGQHGAQSSPPPRDAVTAFNQAAPDTASEAAVTPQSTLPVTGQQPTSSAAITDDFRTTPDSSNTRARPDNIPAVVNHTEINHSVSGHQSGYFPVPHLSVGTSSAHILPQSIPVQHPSGVCYYPFPSYSSSKMPANLPRFKRPTTTNPSSADDFISEFERRCRADSYPVEKWPEALAACCETAEGDWVAKNLVGKGYTMEEVKERFLRHFVDDDIRHHYEQDLFRCSRHQDELLLAFCDRYLSMMKRARRKPDRVDECTTEFLMLLPRHAINWLNSVKAANPEKVNTVRKMVQALTLYSSADRTSVNRVNGQTAAKPAPNPPSNKQQKTGKGSRGSTTITRTWTAPRTGPGRPARRRR